MRKIMTDQQYQALVARSGGSGSTSSQLLVGQSQPHSAQYVSRKLYADRVAAAADPYYAAAAGSSLGASNSQYHGSNRSDSYTESQDIRAQLSAERRSSLLPSPALIDYPSPAYIDHVGNPRAISATPMSPEVASAVAYPGHYASPQRASQALSNVAMGGTSAADLLARARRPPEIAPPAYPSGYGNGVVRRIAPSPASYDEQQGGIFPAQAAGILGPGGGGGRRSQELDRYLLAVQPEKLVRYAASCLAPEPVLRGSRYTSASNNGNPDDDMYSNYRRAKARRTESYDFRASPPGQRRERERESHRQRENYQERRRGDSNTGRQPRGRRSPNNRRSNNGSVTKVHDPNRADRPGNSAQASEGRDGHRNGSQNKRSRPSEASERGAEQPEQGAAKPKQKEDNNDHESDKDSELGSLCADLSDSEEENVKKSEEAATVIDGPLAGMIFICSSATFHECMKLQLFGLPAKNKDDVVRVTPGTKVFLFNFDTKELSGIFEAISHGGWQIQPDAFRDFGGFPAQVQVCCSEQCPNLSQSVFRPAIKQNYLNQNRFKFDLNSKQVKDLVRLFRQAARDRPRQHDDLADRYLNARLEAEDYAARGGHQQRPYSRHPQARFGKSRVSYARVISMSAKTNIRQSKRASKRALTGRKKRKVSNRPESPMADNCSLYSLSGEIPEADVTINASKCCGCDNTSNTNHAVIVGKGIEPGNSRNVDQHKEIVEPLGNTAAKGMDSSGPDHRLSPSKAEEFPQLQSDLGKQVSFVEDSYNDGNFRLTGGRAEEQGQGEALDVLQGAFPTCGDLIKSSDSTLSSMGEELCLEVQGIVKHADPLVNLGGDKVQQLASGTDGDDQLSELDEKNNRQDLGDTYTQEHDNNNDDLGNCEPISIHTDTGGELPDVQTDEMLVETVEDNADCELPHIDKDKELVVSGNVGVHSEAPCVGKKFEVIIPAEPLRTERLTPKDDVDVMKVHDEEIEEVVLIAADVVESELLLSGNMNGLHDDGDDEEEVIIAADGITDCERLASGDENEDEGEKGLDYNCDDGDGEDEDDEIVEVSAGDELSNMGEDDDENEEIVESANNDATCDLD